MSDLNGDTGYAITRELAEVATKLDMLIKDLHDDNVRIEKAHEDLFRRVNKLERTMAQVVVIALACSCIVPIAFELTLKGISVGQNSGLHRGQ